MDKGLPPITSDVFGRAFRAALESPGETISTLVFGALVASGFWWLQCRRERRPVVSLPSGWLQAAKDWIGVVSAALMTMFAVQIVPAVYERDAERQDTISDLRQTNADLRAELDAIQKQPHCPEAQGFDGMLEPRNWSSGLWTTAWNTKNVILDWTGLDRCEATANIAIRIVDRKTMAALPDLGGTMRIVVWPGDKVIAMRDVTNRDPIQRIPLPHWVGQVEYQIQVRLVPDTGMGVDGNITFTSRR